MLRGLMPTLELVQLELLELGRVAWLVLPQRFWSFAQMLEVQVGLPVVLPLWGAELLPFPSEAADI